VTRKHDDIFKEMLAKKLERSNTPQKLKNMMKE
jgi:hypothetical protein